MDFRNLYSGSNYILTRPHWKVSVSINPTGCILNGRPQTFSHLHKHFLYTRMRASDLYRSQYHTQVPNTSVSERTRAIYCPHTSRNLRVLNLRLLASARIVHATTRNWTRLHSRVLVFKLASTRNHSSEYMWQFLWVCHAIVLNSGAHVGWWLEESLYQETRCHGYTTTSICLPPSFYTNEISGIKMGK